MACILQNNRDQIKFVQHNDNYTCIVCRKLLLEPMQLQCGHRICKTCINVEWTLIKCPIGEEDCGEFETKLITPDNAVKKDIERLKVHCLYYSRGCTNQISLKNLQRHLDECRHRPIDCYNKENGCNYVFDGFTLVIHDCPYAVVKCYHCDIDIIKCMRSEHENTCPHVSVGCPYQCGVTNLKRNQLENHFEICSFKPCPCKFIKAGCDYQGATEELEQHLVLSQGEHLSMMLNYVTTREITASEENTTSTEIQASAPNTEYLLQKITVMESSIQHLTNQVSKFQEELRATKGNVAKTLERIIIQERKEEILVTKDEMMDQKASVEELRESMALRPATMNADIDVTEKINVFDRQLAVQSIAMADLEMMQQVLSTVSYDGVLMWKIRDYSRRKRDAVSGRTVSLYSQPFYTHRHGYRMCARVYLNGDGSGKGDHMSLFFVLMKGDHDELLTWPFKHKIKLLLLDQNDAHAQRHLVNSFFPDERSSSFKRPTAEMNVASGCPEFVSQAVLENDSKYLQNDTLFIKIEVEIDS